MMADDVLARLRAANPVPDPDRLAIAGEAAGPVDPELQDLLHRARRIKADETDGELLDRREDEEQALRPTPLRERDRRLAWIAAAAVLAMIAGAVVWTASWDATTDVDVVDAPPAPVGTDDTRGAASTIPAGAQSSCQGDGEAGFAVASDGAVTPGEPPQGERFTKDGQTRTQGLLSLAETSVALNRGSSVVTFLLENPVGEPGGEVWHTLWLRSQRGNETGVIRARGPGAAFERHEILAGDDPDDLQPVDARFARGTLPGGVTGGPVRLVIPADALPVMSEPFLWAFEIRDLELGAGDICPSGVDPTDPLSDPGAMAPFPDDGTGSS